MIKRRIIAAAMAVAAAFALVAFGPALSASADDASTTTFSASSSQTVSYGTNWVMSITVAGTSQYDFVTATSGTVNVLIKGQPGTYATGLPLSAAGIAYLSPPDAQPALPAGTYSVTAVYVPSGTAYLQASQSLTPATLTITPLSMASTFTVIKATINNKPAVQVVATATPPSANAGIPKGSWHVTANDSAGAVAYQSATPLARNPADPVTITLGSKLTAGHDYTVSAKFVPDAAVAGGYTVKNGAPQKVTVESPSFGDVMSTPLALPLWALIVIGLGLALLIATAIVLLVSATKRSRAESPAAEPTQSA